MRSPIDGAELTDAGARGTLAGVSTAVDATPTLSSPLRIGTFEVSGRLMQAAHSKQYSDRAESERETAYFVRRAHGGCALFVAGNHMVHPTGSIRNFPDAFRAASVEANRRMTEAIHDAGARIVVQLNHHGAQAQPDGPDGPRPVFAPSRGLSPSTGHATREASVRDIATFTDAWARSAVLSRESGFDGVEIHLAHGYLLHQFLSPLYNARTDAYGGDLEGRTRFPREVLRAVRAAVGDDFTVGIRIVANEFHPAGIDAAEARAIIAALRTDARIDFLDLAAGGYHNVHYVFPSSAMPVAWLRDEVAAVKSDNPDVPVFGVGAATSVETAAEVIESGIADMVALTRAQLADPDLGVKLRTGRTDIQHCIRLNQGCLGRGSRGLPVTCTVNPLAGRELERGPRPPAATPRRWLVVGGGPAGMRAAVELARDGHAVRLVERAPALGGRLLRASRVPGRDSIRLLIDDLTRDLDALGVDVRLGTEVTPKMLAAAEEVVIATGAQSPIDTALAFGGTWRGAPGRGAVDPVSALTAPEHLGRRIAVVDSDGTAYASGILLSLLDHVEQIEYVTAFETPLPHIGAGYDRQLLLERLAAHGGIRRHAQHMAESITETGLVVRDSLTGISRTLDGLDAVVAVEPRRSVLPDGVTDRMHVIGDALAPRTIDAAIFEAVELAYAVADAVL